ncbi:MAG: TAXI family TRAP transporter solute-binding subunit [Rhodospirillales bacterium]|nr:TAXI family TRAP transporter solute-binding subunit [Rhodospirillales bacterium]MBT3907669.1 TAXI family TRAP transporter solute-binding subunit [Rhodospirillaceae bacterium]MBT5034170.1 TAXI family TRAP transporter solute-binding subunit [Rhodospirillaceae bacterium]MBT6219157.1 TAXI family TRAP transporter solute-binding subunit [Rhodospirillaceae bacterium]MBT6360896.1 TAXI family TRAP transporter solute-binding subunit [Rhodospirillaceae bacterium]
MELTRLYKNAAIATVFGFGVMALAPTAQAEKFITIGTGGQTGVYYQVGGAICKLVNRRTKKHDIKCTHTTGGSTKNINGIRAGNLNMGVAQSDWQYHGYHGTAPKQFPKGAFKALRAVFSVHPEPFTVVARADSGIKSFDDLKGKRVNVGDPGSGQRGTMEVLMGKMGWKMSDFALASELKSSEQSAALCDNKVDAMVFTVGHPNGSIKEASTSCDSVIVKVDNAVVRKLASDNDYYAMATIPGGMYKGTPKDVTTFGVGATFVSSTATSADTVYQIVKAVFDNIKRFRKMHPAFAHLKPKHMIVNNLSAPLHEGALRYYKEKGWK